MADDDLSVEANEHPKAYLLVEHVVHCYNNST
jgi:hypothetical protein